MGTSNFRRIEVPDDPPKPSWWWLAFDHLASAVCVIILVLSIILIAAITLGTAVDRTAKRDRTPLVEPNHRAATTLACDYDTGSGATYCTDPSTHIIQQAR